MVVASMPMSNGLFSDGSLIVLRILSFLECLEVNNVG